IRVNSPTFVLDVVLLCGVTLDVLPSSRCDPWDLEGQESPGRRLGGSSVADDGEGCSFEAQEHACFKLDLCFLCL
ncbi:hypothetical protein Tco_1534211, partial [Tanacetum coccineum]